MTLEERKQKAREIGQIDNSTLYAGEPMYFYCKHCGLLSDTLPEDYTCTPNHVCKECEKDQSDG